MEWLLGPRHGVRYKTCGMGEAFIARFLPSPCPRQLNCVGLYCYSHAIGRDSDKFVRGVEGCCPAHNIIHPQCPRQVRRLLQLMVGEGEGLVVGEGVGCGVRARGQAGELGHSLLGHCPKRMRREFESCEKANSGNKGEFVQNSYELRTKFVRIRTKLMRISHSRESVNLA